MICQDPTTFLLYGNQNLSMEKSSLMIFLYFPMLLEGITFNYLRFTKSCFYQKHPLLYDLSTACRIPSFKHDRADLVPDHDQPWVFWEAGCTSRSLWAYLSAAPGFPGCQSCHSDPSPQRLLGPKASPKPLRLTNPPPPELDEHLPNRTTGHFDSAACVKTLPVEHSACARPARWPPLGG